jgi:hypothetical protein
VARQKNQPVSFSFQFHVLNVAAGYFNFQHDVVLMNPLLLVLLWFSSVRVVLCSNCSETRPNFVW